LLFVNGLPDIWLEPWDKLVAMVAPLAAQFCTGVVIPEREMNFRQIFDKPSRTWFLQCSVCLHKFAIAETKLKFDIFSVAKLRQLYPEDTPS